MSSTYSPSLKLTLIGDGEQAGIWGQTTNTNLGTLLEQAITGVVTVNMPDANYTLTNFNGITDEARNAVIVVTGTNNAQRDLIPPVVEKLYTISNQTSGGYAIRVIGTSGTGVTIPNGVTTLVYCDGTNFYSGLSGSAGDFTVNGALGVTSTLAVVGNSLIGGTLGVTGATAFTGIPSGPTAAGGTNTTQLATTAFVTSAVNAIVSVPPGTINMWPTDSAPIGYLLCNGAAIDRTTYSVLFSIIGTTFGVGDTTTTFNLPNYTNRMPYGTTIGATGGSADAIVVTHTHAATVVDPGHFHTTLSTTNASIGSSVPTLSGTSTSNTSTEKTGISVSNANAGASGTNANLPPYLGINFIIKT